MFVESEHSIASGFASPLASLIRRAAEGDLDSSTSRDKGHSGDTLAIGRTEGAKEGGGEGIPPFRRRLLSREAPDRGVAGSAPRAGRDRKVALDANIKEGGGKVERGIGVGYTRRYTRAMWTQAGPQARNFICRNTVGDVVTPVVAIAGTCPRVS